MSTIGYVGYLGEIIGKTTTLSEVKHNSENIPEQEFFLYDENTPYVFIISVALMLKMLVYRNKKECIFSSSLFSLGLHSPELSMPKVFQAYS